MTVASGGDPPLRGRRLPHTQAALPQNPPRPDPRVVGRTNGFPMTTGDIVGIFNITTGAASA